MKSNYLVNTCIDIATKFKTLYVYGCFGAPLNATNKKRYTHNYAYNEKPSRTKKILAASADTFGFDCVCLIKGILWGWNGNVNATYGGAKYPTEEMLKNGACPDENANTLFNDYCYDKSNDFSNVQPGEFVWMNGHIGVAITDKLAVECTPIWKDGVQITAMNCDVKGYNRRNWTSHGKSKFIDYTDTPKPEPKPEPDTKPVSKEIKLGDTVIVNGVGTAASTGEGARTRKFVNHKMKVIMISGNTRRPNRYALNQYDKGNVGDPRAVTGWFSIKDIKKK